MHFLIKFEGKKNSSWVLAFPDSTVCSWRDKEKELFSHLDYLIEAAGRKASIASDCRTDFCFPWEAG